MDPGHNSHFQNPFSVACVSINDRFPQWSIDETRDLLMVRAELDPNFVETKRNKVLWEVISTRMREMGHPRTPEQCKCKWKNLVTRYKGCETMGAEGNSQQFPFYNEMQTIYTTRMQRMTWLAAEAAAATTSKKKAAPPPHYSSSDEDENYCTEKKRKTKGHIENPIVNGIREIMKEFMKQQMDMEMQWLKAYEEREEKRKLREMEWRQKMEEILIERLMMNKKMMEMEEQRKIREEIRAQKRDALIDVLLNKLRREGM